MHRDTLVSGHGSSRMDDDRIGVEGSRMMEKTVTEILDEEAIASNQNAKPTFKWKGEGFCKARHVREHRDYCNNPTEHTYCSTCECSVHKCHEQWSIWNMAYGKFCSNHRSRIPKEE